MNNQERIEKIEEARELIIEAQDLVEEAVEGTKEENRYRGYGRFGFDTLLNNGNQYDDGLDDLVKEFSKEEE